MIQKITDERPRNKIQPQDGAAVIAVVTQRNLEEAAAVGVSAATSAAVAKATGVSEGLPGARWPVPQSIARLQHATGAAVTTLLKVMVDPASPPSAKVRAADMRIGSLGEGHRIGRHRNTSGGTGSSE